MDEWEAAAYRLADVRSAGSSFNNAKLKLAEYLSYLEFGPHDHPLPAA